MYEEADAHPHPILAALCRRHVLEDVPDGQGMLPPAQGVSSAPGKDSSGSGDGLDAEGGGASVLGGATASNRHAAANKRRVEEMGAGAGGHSEEQLSSRGEEVVGEEEGDGQWYKRENLSGRPLLDHMGQVCEVVCVCVCVCICSVYVCVCVCVCVCVVWLFVCGRVKQGTASYRSRSQKGYVRHEVSADKTWLRGITYVCV